MRYAVTGVTGQLGQLVVKHLLNHADASDEFVALARSPEKAQLIFGNNLDIRTFDYSQAGTLTDSLSGVDRLLLISSSEVGMRTSQHKAVIEAAISAGVGQIVYTSLLKADTSPMLLAHEHKETEALIKSSGLPYVILRNGWYSENYTQSIPTILQTGAVVGAAEEGCFSTASRADYAEAAAKVLVSKEDLSGQTFELAGDQSFTLLEFAQEIAKQSGQKIAHKNMEMGEFQQLLVQVGLLEEFAKVLADAEQQAATGWLQEEGKSLSNLIGRPTTSIATAISTALELIG